MFEIKRYLVRGMRFMLFQQVNQFDVADIIFLALSIFLFIKKSMLLYLS